MDRAGRRAAGLDGLERSAKLATSLRLPDKLAARRALQAALEQSLETMAAAARTTREGAVHEENRAEGDKDMRSTEQSYLARGQAMRVEDLAEQLRRLRADVFPTLDADAAIGPGALVAVEIDGTPRAFFLVPYGAGLTLRVEDVDLTVVTPASPVGRALLGKQVGDDLELLQRGKRCEAVITDVA